MTRALILGTALAFIAVSNGYSEKVVHFENGQAMRVEKTRREGRWLFMELGSDGEMAVLLRQVKKVEEAEPLPGKAGSSRTAANVVSAAGSRAARGRGAPAAQGYNAMRSGQEPRAGTDPEAAAAAEAAQAEARAQAAAAQGRDLVPRASPRGSRRNPNRTPPR